MKWTFASFPHMAMSLSDDEIGARVEAALYAAGRPLSLEDLVKASGISSKRRVVRIARSLAHAVKSNLRAIQVLELDGQRFVMQLKPEYNPIAKRFAIKPLLPTSVLKTLSYVVYFQPISAKEVAIRRGPQAYGHLRTLEEFGFVYAERNARARIYRTTPRFSEYFGLSSDPQVMKQQLEKLGVVRPYVPSKP